MARADKFSALSKTPIYYSDFTNNLDLNPETGFISMLTNAQAVANSIRNLVMTNKYERRYQPKVGSKVQSLLFDLNDPTTHGLLVQTLNETIAIYESRAFNVEVTVDEVIDSYQVLIGVKFSMVNIVQPFSFQLILKRVR